MENWFGPTTAHALVPAQRVLVYAPHPDDEVFGCGGCAALYARAGAQLRVCILSDGGGHLEGEQRQAAVATRQEESRRACAILGIGEPVFGAWADRALSAQDGLALKMRHDIEAFRPDVVFAPSPWEVHPDHRATAWAVLQAVDGLAAGDGPAIAFYEVGAPLRPNRLVDISSVWDEKKRAMAAFASQLQRQKYDVHIAALNTYRTYTLGPEVAAAEALIVVARGETGAWLASYAQSRPLDLADATETALRHAAASAEDMIRTMVDLSAQVAAQQQTIAGLEKDIAAVQAELAAQRAQAEATEGELRASIDDLQRRLAAAQQALADVFASRSWKVTRPLRWVGEKLR